MSTKKILENDVGLAFPRSVKEKGTHSRRKNPILVKKYKDEHPMCEVPDCYTRGWKGPHHIIFRSQGGKDEKKNLIRVCSRHHECAHGVRAAVWREVFEGVKADG